MDALANITYIPIYTFDQDAEADQMPLGNPNRCLGPYQNSCYWEGIPLYSREVTRFDAIDCLDPEQQALEEQYVHVEIPEPEMAADLPFIPGDSSMTGKPMAGAGLSSSKPVEWLKAFFGKIKGLLARSGSVGACEKKEVQELVSLLPSVCSEVVEDQKRIAVQLLARCNESLRPTPVYELEEPFYDCIEPTEEQWLELIELEEISRKRDAEAGEEEKPVIMNAHALVPVENLDRKVWQALCRLLRPLKPSGEKVKQTAELLVSEEKLDKLTNAVKGAAKNHLNYEINDNLGRRLIQVMLAAGVQSPLLPALSLLGFAIPGISTLSLVLMIWRLKDFRDEFNAIYYDRNAVPAATDAALTFAPQAFRLLL